MTIAKILQAATAELKESNDRAEQDERNRKIEAEIMAQRLKRFEIPDEEWTRAYQAEMAFQSLLKGQI